MVAIRRALRFLSATLILTLAACTNPFYDRVKEVVDAAKAPRMALSAESIPVASGGSYDFGPVTVAAVKSVVFTITNAGRTDLALSGGTNGITIAGANADQFSMAVPLSSTVISAGKGGTFTLTFAPTSGGAKTASVTLGSNDPQASDYTFTLTGGGAAAAPTFTPNPGTYNADQNVSLSSPGATIYYTTDGSEPTAASPVFSAAIPVVGNGTTVVIKAFAEMAGYSSSAVVSGTFTINTSLVPASQPMPFPPPGTYPNAQSVVLSASILSIVYTTDGSLPTTDGSGTITHGTLFSGSIPVSQTTTIKAVAFGTGWLDSPVATFAYTLQAQPPLFAMPNGRIGMSATVYITPAFAGSEIAFTTDGSDPTTNGSGTITNGTHYVLGIQHPVVPFGTRVVKAIAYNAGWIDSPVATRTYTKPLFLYASEQGSPGNIEAFSLDPATGVIAFAGLVGVSAVPAGMSIDSHGRFLYVSESGEITGFAVNADTGVLTLSTMLPTADFPGAIRMRRPANDALYAANPAAGVNSIFTASVSGAGILSPVATVPAGVTPSALAMDPSGQFLYALCASGISAYTVGSITPVAVGGSPFPASPNPSDIVVDPSGSYLYQADSVNGTVLGYVINPGTGSLTSIPGSPFTVAAGTSKMTIHPSGRFLYLTHSLTSMVELVPIDPGTGSLMVGGGAQYGTGTSPRGVCVDPEGRYLYVANFAEGTIGVYHLNPGDGTLTFWTTFSTTMSGPMDILITGTD